MLNRRGLTLLESTVALVIVGIIVAAVWGVYAKVSFNNNVSRTERGIVNTVAKIRNFYGDRVITSGELDNAKAMEFELIAPELIIGGTPMHHLGANGAADLVIGSGTTAACGPTMPPNVFFLRLDNMSQEGCHQIVARMVGNRGKVNEYGIFSAFINGTSPLPTGVDFSAGTARWMCEEENVSFLMCFRQN